MGNTIESYKTEAAQSATASSKTIKIPVCIKTPSHDNKYNCTFRVYAVYGKDETLRNIIHLIKKQMGNKYYPLQFKVIWIYSDNSFIKEGISGDDINISYASIISYNKKEIIKKGLCIEMNILKYQHTVLSDNIRITCDHMLMQKTLDPLKCPIYFRTKKKYECSRENLRHLNACKHHKKHEQRSECKHKDKCGAYIRLENGGNKLSDLCHIKLYRHPPRGRSIKLQQDINCLVFNRKQKQNCKVYEPSNIDITLYNHIYGHQKEWNEHDGFLNSLLEEVIKNNFKNDLYLKDNDTDNFLKIIDLKMQNSVSSTYTREQIFEKEHAQQEAKQANEYSILNIVNDKLNSYRHMAMSSPLNKAQMLALILYTGCECSYDLSTSQRNGDYNKWKWFDYCLYSAICLLSANENGLFDVYSGLNKVRLNEPEISGAYFVTYVSASWNKQVALSFIDGDGMLIHIEKQFKNHNRVHCCDVSWISKFPDEQEVLFARSTEDWTDKGFNCIVTDYQNKIQTVSLSLSKHRVINDQQYQKYQQYAGLHKNRLYSFNSDQSDQSHPSHLCDDDNENDLPENKTDLSPSVSIDFVPMKDIIGIVHQKNVSVQYKKAAATFNRNIQFEEKYDEQQNMHIKSLSDMITDVD